MELEKGYMLHLGSGNISVLLSTSERQTGVPSRKPYLSSLDSTWLSSEKPGAIRGLSRELI